MFKNSFQIAVFFALIALLVKLMIFTLNLQHGQMELNIVYAYLLLSLSAVFLGIRSNKFIENLEPSFINNFKSGARTATFFALLIFGITYIYYEKIDPEFFKIKHAQAYETYREQVRIDLSNGVPKEEIKEKLTKQIVGLKSLFSPYSQALFTTFGLVFIGMFYALTLSLLASKTSLGKAFK